MEEKKERGIILVGSGTGKTTDHIINEIMAQQKRAVIVVDNQESEQNPQLNIGAVSGCPSSQIKIKMENQNLEVGKIYDVVSQRKGKFKMQLTHHDETWATGVITKGKAKAILAYNEVEKGEEVTVRKSFTTFTAVS